VFRKKTHQSAMKTPLRGGACNDLVSDLSDLSVTDFVDTQRSIPFAVLTLKSCMWTLKVQYLRHWNVFSVFPNYHDYMKQRDDKTLKTAQEKTNLVVGQ
jgi:hypothetical protein